MEFEQANGTNYQFYPTCHRQTVKLEDSKSYAIVETWAATARKSFPHEVGHLFGCRHENDDTEAPSYGKAYCIKTLGITTDRTIMVGNNLSDNQAANRLLHFSNPNVQVGGKATGTNNENNAKRVSESHNIVSNFRPNPTPPLVAYIDGPTYVTTQGGKNYELNYSCGSAPYSIVWHYSYDGVNYNKSNITADIFTWYFYQNQKIYLKGTVTANGSSTTAFIAVTAQMPSPFKLGQETKDSLGSSSKLLKIAPNPASSSVTISYDVNILEEEPILEIVNHRGEVLQVSAETTREEIRRDYVIKAGNLSPGIYLARLRIGDLAETARFIILP